MKKPIRSQWQVISILSLAIMALVGCQTTSQGGRTVTRDQAQRPLSVFNGTVLRVSEVQIQGRETGLGAVAGFADGTLGLYEMFEIVRTTGGIFGFNQENFTLDLTGFSNGLGGYPLWLVQRGNSLFLERVPEPTTLSLLALGGLALLRRRRKN